VIICWQDFVVNEIEANFILHFCYTRVKARFPGYPIFFLQKPAALNITHFAGNFKRPFPIAPRLRKAKNAALPPQI